MSKKSVVYVYLFAKDKNVSVVSSAERREWLHVVHHCLPAGHIVTSDVANLVRNRTTLCGIALSRGFFFSTHRPPPRPHHPV